MNEFDWPDDKEKDEEPPFFLSLYPPTLVEQLSVRGLFFWNHKDDLLNICVERLLSVERFGATFGERLLSVVERLLSVCRAFQICILLIILVDRLKCSTAQRVLTPHIAPKRRFSHARISS